MINIGIGVGWAKALYSVANNVIANFKARVLSYPNSIFEAGPCLDATLEELNAIGLLDNASLVITPNAYNEGILYDVIPNTTLGDMDVVRATTATRVNSAGLIEVVPRNLLTYSEQIDTANWVRQGVSATANQAISPNGTLTAELLDDGTAASTQHWIFQNTPLLNSTTYTMSFYAKYISRKFIAVNIFNGLASQYVYYNIQDGLISGSTGDVTASITSVGNGWFRIVYTRPMSTSGSSPNFRIALADDTSNITYTGSNKQAYVWGFQLEAFPTATEYFPTTTRLNIPRIDYTNGSCPSLLVEPQRTNVVLQSSDLSQTIWSKSNYILTPTSTIQGLIATRITKNAINNGVYNGTGVRNLINTVGTFAAGVKTLSFYIRKGNTDKVAFVINNILVGVSTSVNCEFNFNTKTFTNVAVGLTASFENYNTDVYKIILTINDIGVSTGKAIWIAPIDASNNTVDGGYLDFAFAQWELGSYPTSYIPTVASTVTRNADIVSNSNLISKGLIVNDYTLVLDITNPILGNQYILDSRDISSVRTGILRVDGTTASVTDIGGGSSLSILSILTIGKGKMCLKRTGNVISFFANGVKCASTTTTTAGTINTLSTGVTNSTTGSYINSTSLFPLALTDTECIALTTL